MTNEELQFQKYAWNVGYVKKTSWLIILPNTQDNQHRFRTKIVCIEKLCLHPINKTRNEIKNELKKPVSSIFIRSQMCRTVFCYINCHVSNPNDSKTIIWMNHICVSTVLCMYVGQRVGTYLAKKYKLCPDQTTIPKKNTRTQSHGWINYRNSQN